MRDNSPHLDLHTPDLHTPDLHTPGFRTPGFRTGDRGHAVLLVAVTIVFAGLFCIGAASLGSAMLHRQQAQAAADAAALAGVEGGRVAAERLASRNGAALVIFRRDGARVTVSVRLGGATAVASASNGP